jgi:hypothetical protein
MLLITDLFFSCQTKGVSWFELRTESKEGEARELERKENVPLARGALSPKP